MAPLIRLAALDSIGSSQGRENLVTACTQPVLSLILQLPHPHALVPGLGLSPSPPTCVTSTCVSILIDIITYMLHIMHIILHTLVIDIIISIIMHISINIIDMRVHIIIIDMSCVLLV